MITGPLLYAGISSVSFAEKLMDIFQEPYPMALADGLSIGIPILFTGLVVFAHSGISQRRIIMSESARLGIWISVIGITFMLPFFGFLHSQEYGNLSLLLIPLILLISGQKIIGICNRKVKG
jgi:hypothetical protein